MKHYLLNNGRPLADICYVIYQNQINFSAECLSQDGDVCINQISVENEHQLRIGSILNVIQRPGSASSGNALKNLIHAHFIQPLTTCWGTVQHKTAFQLGPRVLKECICCVKYLIQYNQYKHHTSIK